MVSIAETLHATSLSDTVLLGQISLEPDSQRCGHLPDSLRAATNSVPKDDQKTNLTT
jgi:hypothetical protein